MDVDPRGHAGAWQRHQRHVVVTPPPDLAGFVERIWSVEWDYAEPYRQKIVPLPQVHVTVEPAVRPLTVVGVVSRFAVRELRGTGGVIGAALWPGTARVLLGRPVSALTDRRELLAAPRTDLLDVDGLVSTLRTVLPAEGPGRAARDARDLVAAVAENPGHIRVEDLARWAGIGVRTVQRLFREHVGVSPKWVLRRYRLAEVTAALDAGDPMRWADVAADLGYADQAHLSRDFADLFGEPPTTYAQRY